LKKRSIGAKIGGGIMQLADVAVGGALRGAVSKLIPRNMELKTMNYLDLQKALPKTLIKIKDLEVRLDAVKSVKEKVQVLRSEIVEQRKEQVAETKPVKKIKKETKTSLETPSVKDFNKYQKLAPEIKFKGLDDMKLIRSKETGEVIGVKNRAGDTKMFRSE